MCTCNRPRPCGEDDLIGWLKKIVISQEAFAISMEEVVDTVSELLSAEFCFVRLHGVWEQHGESCHQRSGCWTFSCRRLKRNIWLHESLRAAADKFNEKSSKQGPSVVQWLRRVFFVLSTKFAGQFFCWVEFKVLTTISYHDNVHVSAYIMNSFSNCFQHHASEHLFRVTFSPPFTTMNAKTRS